MPDLKDLYSRYKKYLFYLLALFVLGWGFSDYKSIFAGLILGTAASFYNLWLLYRRTVKFSEAIAAGRSVYSLGSLSRLASAALVAIISIRFPEHFNLIAALIGLMTVFIVILIDSLFKFVIKGNQQEER